MKLITIVGAGAIGGTTGVLLSRAGHDVVLVDQDQHHVGAINRDGYRLSGIHDIIQPMNAITPDELGSLVDQRDHLGLVILAVKAMNTESAISQIVPWLADDGVVISFQNGLNEEVISSVIGKERTIGAFVHFGADLVEPAHVRVSDRYPTYISEMDMRRTERIEQIAKTLSAVTDVEVTDNLLGYLWGKLSWATMGFIAATVDAPTDEVVMNSDARFAIRAAVAEVMDIARAQGITLENIHGFDPNLFDRNNPNRIEETDVMFDQWAEQGKNAVKRHTGIHRDIKVRRRRTEIDYQIGEVVEKGRELGIPAPVNAALLKMIHEIESGEKLQSWDSIEELGMLARTVESSGSGIG